LGNYNNVSLVTAKPVGEGSGTTAGLGAGAWIAILAALVVGGGWFMMSRRKVREDEA
jgi:hypothetical protein